jgi:uncharacterized protein
VKGQVLLVHSAGPQGRHEGSGELVARLEDMLGEDFEVLFPKMPDPDNPRYEPWRTEIQRTLGGLQAESPVLVGHSLGGSILLKYLCEEGLGQPAGGVLIVAAPFWGTSGWEAEYALPDPTPTATSGLPPTFLFHSRDDEEIPFSHLERYANRFPDATVHPLDGTGHLFDRGDISEIVETVRSLAP